MATRRSRRARERSPSARAAARAGDASAAFDALFRELVSRAAVKNALRQALAAASGDRRAADATAREHLAPALEVVLARAKAAGAVRPDIGLPELTSLLVGASRAVEHLNGDAAASERVVSVVLSRLRPPDRGGI